MIARGKISDWGHGRLGIWQGEHRKHLCCLVHFILSHIRIKQMADFLICCYSIDYSNTAIDGDLLTI